MNIYHGMEIKVKLGIGTLNLSIEQSSIREDEFSVEGYLKSKTGKEYNYQQDYFKSYVKDNLDEVMYEFETYFNKQVTAYSFFDGFTGNHKSFSTLEELIEHCQKNIRIWIEDRENNVDYSNRESVKYWIRLLSNYEVFLDLTEDTKAASHKIIAQAIEGMYNTLDDSNDWKVYHNGKDLAEGGE